MFVHEVMLTYRVCRRPFSTGFMLLASCVAKIEGTSSEVLYEEFGGHQPTHSQLDGHSNPEFAKHLQEHLSAHQEHLETTREMYSRIRQTFATSRDSVQPADIRIRAMMALETECTSGAHCDVTKFVSERLMPAALREVSRRFKILKPVQTPLKLPRHCSRVLDTGNCAEVRISFPRRHFTRRI
jgi:hypothetical protein